MARQEGVERRFSELLDRLLAGEDVQLAPDAGDELRESLAFAREMAALRPDPREVFQRQLQARLTEQLRIREAEAAARGSFWERLRRNPVWQGVTAAVFVIILAALLWRSGVFHPSLEPTQVPTATSTTTATTTTPAPTTTATATQTVTPTATATATQPSTVVSLKAGATTDKQAYLPGEAVAITVTLTNAGPTPVVLTDLPPIVSILSADTGQPVYTFAAGKNSLNVPTGTAVQFTLDWNGRDFNGQPVTGSYYIELEDLNYGDQPVPLPLETPARFDIVTTR